MLDIKKLKGRKTLDKKRMRAVVLSQFKLLTRTSTDAVMNLFRMNVNRNYKIGD